MMSSPVMSYPVNLQHSFSTIPRLWQRCSDRNFHDTLQFLSRQTISTANDMAVDLLLYLEAHLFHHHHLTANIWLHLVRENLIKVKTLDYRLVGRMKNYAYAAQNVTCMYQYITNRWQEGWWKKLNFAQVSHLGHGIWVSLADIRVWGPKKPLIPKTSPERMISTRQSL
jgi:hypothetical protein